ncbi:ThiF family protein [Plectosphaerella cucumerina]|uniref:Ubiquitin-like 1-activating enzyme E1A n=1 Tax=Plectosphaerella cucumerina TaxID=40658 RepID=A0A8K0T5T5_9PEZI|nr:ThiF family protein [Plectosphaerella cucumerina]
MDQQQQQNPAESAPAPQFQGTSAPPAPEPAAAAPIPLAGLPTSGDALMTAHSAPMDQVLPEALQEVAPAAAVPELLPGSLPAEALYLPQQQLFLDPNNPQQLADPTVMAAPAVDNTISAAEIALYDRQIRLWGLQAQQRIRGANVLLITMKALANEVAKNLVLAGIGSLTILDGDVVTEADLGSQFFLSAAEGHIGRNRAEAASAAIARLNPRVRVIVDQESIKAKGTSYFAAFDVVVATDLDSGLLTFINTATRLHQKPFYAAGTHGLYGFVFSDLIEHEYVIERDLSNVPTRIGPEGKSRTRSVVGVKTKTEGGKTRETVTKRELYSTWFLSSDGSSLPEEFAASARRRRAVGPALSCLRALWEFQSLSAGRLPGLTKEDLGLFTKLATGQHAQLGLPAETLRSDFLRSFLQNLGSEIAPVTAILGGQLAQDVINVLGQSQQPIQNTIIFDGNTMESSMYSLHPAGALGRELLSFSTPAPANGLELLQPLPGVMMNVDGTIDFSGGGPIMTQ